MNQETVVIVDDDCSFVQALAKFLGRRGFRTLLAHDGPNGLVRLQSPGVDLAIIDVHLPGLGGMAVLQRFRAAGGTAPCILISSDDCVEVRQACLAAGALRFLAKPVVPAELLQAVCDVLEKHV
jgi:DNA-binding response OmpR family regulator